MISTTDWIKILKKDSLYKKSIRSLLKKLSKILAGKKQLIDYLGAMLLNPEDCSVDKLLKLFITEAKMPEHPFSSVTYTHDIILSNGYLHSEAEERAENTLRQTCVLSNNQIFNGFLNNLYNEISRFYFGNNLVLAWNYDPSTPQRYTCDVFVDDSRTLLIQVEEGQIKSSKLLIKGSNTGEDGNRNIYYKFHKNTWMVKRSTWTHILKPFLGPHSEGCKFDF